MNYELTFINPQLIIITVGVFINRVANATKATTAFTQYLICEVYWFHLLGVATLHMPVFIFMVNSS